MITFLFDACALARRYFEDIGTTNIDQICRYPDSNVAFPNLAYAEATSAIIAAYNGGLLGEGELETSLSLLDADVLSMTFTKIKVDDEHVSDAATLLRRHKLIPRGQQGTGKAGIGGADAIYLAITRALTREARNTDDRVILVTSDGALYQSAMDEPESRSWRFSTFGRANAALAATCASPQKPRTTPALSAGRGANPVDWRTATARS